MRERLVIPGIVCLVLGILAFFTASEIQVQVGVLPFTFVLIVFFVIGLVLVIAGVVAYIANRL